MEWARDIIESIPHGTRAKYIDMSSQKQIPESSIASTACDTGLVRVRLSGEDVDVFRQPTECSTKDFEIAWNSSEPLDNDLRLVDDVFLIAMKYDTGRDTDAADRAFLESSASRRLESILVSGPSSDVLDILKRSKSRLLAARSLSHPDLSVREFATDLIESSKLDNLSKSERKALYEILDKKNFLPLPTDIHPVIK